MQRRIQESPMLDISEVAVRRRLSPGLRPLAEQLADLRHSEERTDSI
jgi:hypothetical protein